MSSFRHCHIQSHLPSGDTAHLVRGACLLERGHRYGMQRYELYIKSPSTWKHADVGILLALQTAGIPLEAAVNAITSAITDTVPGCLTMLVVDQAGAGDEVWQSKKRTWRAFRRGIVGVAFGRQARPAAEKRGAR